MKTSRKIRYVLLIYVTLVVVVSLAPSSGASFWHIDKIGHFLAYGGMAILALLSFPVNSSRLAALLGCVALGAFLEWGQSFVPGRDMSLVDGLANTLGVLTGALFFRCQGQRLPDWIRAHFEG